MPANSADVLAHELPLGHAVHLGLLRRLRVYVTGKLDFYLTYSRITQHTNDDMV
ncbi:MAG: hypothetical protein ROW52_01850 [Anaerolineaceae bacterium]